MVDVIRYGVFSLGQIWTVVGDDGVRLGFPNRTEAVRAAWGLVALHVAQGIPAELIALDDGCRLSVLEPPESLRPL